MMIQKRLKIHSQPMLDHGKMVLAFSGWMDGGDVSTGTVKRLIKRLDAVPIAEIDPDIFYIYNFPGAMEVSAMFRPHIKIEDGVVRSFNPPANKFYYVAQENLIFFVGKEPNLNWEEFGDCIFTLASMVGISMIYFVGSFGGSVPHTRQPRLYATVSDAQLKSQMEQYGIKPTNYEGPGSYSAYLMTQAQQRGIDMASLVAEIPGYLHGTNPMSIEVVTRKLAILLALPVDLEKLRGASDEWESRVTEEVEKNPKLAEKIRQLEIRYDDELITPPDAETV